MRGLPADSKFERLHSALHCSKYTSGSTHSFYLYPARFSPEIARAVIDIFSEPGDWVLDPFMGGGTGIIEGLAIGRSMIGADLNALAHFVAKVRTTPLSAQDEVSLRSWASRVARHRIDEVPAPRGRVVDNLPRTMRTFIAHALRHVQALHFPRQQAFARCVLLRLGQWALDCRDHGTPRRDRLGSKLSELTNLMLAGLRDFVAECKQCGIRKGSIVGRRLLICRDATEIHEDSRVRALPQPRLVLTSPPYPSVHVLYHRWQVRGRRETTAPYWIAQVPDGYYESHYTGGSRTPTGERRYFSMIRAVFSSVKELLAPDGMVVQLVGFADVKRQLPQYLTAMDEAGFDPFEPHPARSRRLWRNVPNRKWYAKLQGAVDASSELLLFHRPRRR